MRLHEIDNLHIEVLFMHLEIGFLQVKCLVTQRTLCWNTTKGERVQVWTLSFESEILIRRLDFKVAISIDAHQVARLGNFTELDWKKIVMSALCSDLYWIKAKNKWPLHFITAYAFCPSVTIQANDIVIYAYILDVMYALYK